MSNLVTQTIASTISVIAGGTLTLLGVYINGRTTERRALKDRKRKEISELQGARFEVGTYQREIRLSEIFQFSYVRSNEILQGLPTEQRPSNYENVHQHQKKQIEYYREEVEASKAELVRVIKGFHGLVVEVQQAYEDERVAALCNRLLARGMPDLELPSEDINTKEKVDTWRKNAMESIEASIRTDTIDAIDELLGIMKAAELSQSRASLNRGSRFIDIWDGIKKALKD